MAMEKKYGLYTVKPPQYFAIIEPDIENVVLVDSDLQYDPKESVKILNSLESREADLVMGYRNWRKVPFRHKLGNFVWRNFFNILFASGRRGISILFPVFDWKI